MAEALLAAPRHDIYGMAKQVLELAPRTEQVEERASRLELDEEVDVAELGLVAARHRPEQRDAAASMAAHRGLHLVSPALDERSEGAIGHETRGTSVV